MASSSITSTPHSVPADLKRAIESSAEMNAAWVDITPLARNEFICWITSAIKPETRARRIEVARDKLTRGERRPCCWQGCGHRSKVSSTPRGTAQ